MSHLENWANSERFDPNTIIYCHMDLKFEFEDGTKVNSSHKMRPFSRSMEKYVPMKDDPNWVARFAHEFENNKHMFKGMFAAFLDARKILKDKLDAGEVLVKFNTRYYACDESHACKSKIARIGDKYTDDCKDPVAAAKEVSTWVKHTMAYAG